MAKKLKSVTKEGLDIDDEDEKKKLEELKAEFASADKSDKTVKDLIWLLFDTALLTSDEDLPFNMKLGIHEDSTNRTKIAEFMNRYYYYYTKIVELMRYQTSISGDVQISLKEYVDRMNEGHGDFCYIIGGIRGVFCSVRSYIYCMFLILILYGFPFVRLNRPLFVRICRVLCLSICVRAGSTDPLNRPII